MIGRSSLFPPQLVPTVPVPRTAAAPRGRGAGPGTPRGAKARRAVLWFAAALVCATAGFAVALDTKLTTVRFPEYGHRLAAVRRLQAEHPDRPLALVIGSSRTQMALDPSAAGFANEPGAPLVFNFGLAGALPVHHPLGYRRVRAAGVKPAAVVVEVFPALLCVTDASHTLYADGGAGLTAAELAALSRDTRDSKLARSWLRSRVFALGSYQQGFQRQALPHVFPSSNWSAYDRQFPDGNGFHAFPTREIADEDRRRATDKARTAYRKMCQTLPLAPMAERAYRELVAECRADGVPVAFYLTPESPLFHEFYTEESRAALAGFVKVFTDELGVPVFDLSGGWENGDFWDGHHMLPDGAAKFTRRLADRHLRPWFATALPATR